MMVKRALSLFVVISVMVLTLISCKPEYEGEAKNDFRGVNWGMSRAKVDKTEDVEATYASEEVLLYRLNEYDDEIQVFYQFIDDKLVSGEIRVQMKDQITNSLVNDMIESYIRYRDRMIELYGLPVNDDFRIWYDDEGDKADRDAYNIYFKHMGYLTEWDSESTYMKLIFNFENDVINYIFYAEQKG